METSAISEIDNITSEERDSELTENILPPPPDYEPWNPSFYPDWYCSEFHPSYKIFFPDRPLIQKKLKSTIPKKSLFSMLNCRNVNICSNQQSIQRCLRIYVRYLTETNKGTTTIVDIADKRYKCHFALLKSFSNWFGLKNKQQNYYSLPIKLIPQNGFEEAYKWMRNAKFIINRNNVIELMQTARQLEMHVLIEQCIHYLTKIYIIDNICIDLYAEASRFELLNDVCGVLLSRIRKYFLTFVGSELYMNTGLVEIKAMLNSSFLSVNTEIEVLFAAIKWLSGNFVNRSTYVDQVFRCIRFAYLPVVFIHNLYEYFNDNADLAYNKSPVLVQFGKNKSNQMLLDNALAYIALKHDFENDYEGFKKELLGSKLSLQEPRLWAYDPECKYHIKHQKFPSESELSYDQFLEYIEKLQVFGTHILKCPTEELTYESKQL